MNIKKSNPPLIIGTIILMCTINLNAQVVNSDQTDNYTNTSQQESIERFEDGRIKVQVNTKMINQFYESLSKPENENISWSELLDTYRNDKKTFITFWKSYTDDQHESNQTNSQNSSVINSLNKENMKAEYLSNGEIKVQINTKKLNELYKTYNNQNYIAWSELLYSYSSDKTKLLATWESFKNSKDYSPNLATKTSQKTVD